MKPYFFAILLLSMACQSTQPVSSPSLQEMVETSLTPRLYLTNRPSETHTIEDRMAYYQVPGLSIAVIEKGAIAWSKGYGLANTDTKLAVNTETLFQAGSISKPLAALGALHLVQNGKIGLDEDVNQYLQGWQIEENPFTSMEKITLRRLLTHTAGLTVHGFPGYTFEEEIPSVVDVLDGKGNTAAILPDTTPGVIWRYSGGGYTVMQKLVEDLSGEPFEDYVQREVLTPLGMLSSTYEQPLPESMHARASAAFDSKGEMAEGLWNNYPEKAAAGLWTTPTELAYYLIEMQQAYAGSSSKVLNQDMTRQMLTKHKNDWGLGPSLNLDGDSLMFGHGGKNRGFTNNMTAFVHGGSGAIVMTNADRGGPLINEIMRAISQHYDWGLFQQDTMEVIDMKAEELARFAGEYQLDTGDSDPLLFEMQVDGDGLHVVGTNNDNEFILLPQTEMDFFDTEDGMVTTFLEDETGKITGLKTPWVELQKVR
ncbi:MAG: serine hydrolase domain-containing protein [Bacteroidota bacterium]